MVEKSAKSIYFCRQNFSLLPLDNRLTTLLEKDVQDGGLGLFTSTRIQNVVLSILAGNQGGSAVKSNADGIDSAITESKQAQNPVSDMTKIFSKLPAPNILMKSETGSGKTLAYLLPIINDLMSIVPRINRAEGTRALIIAPTRELCSQIADVLSQLTQCCVWIVSGSITGGEKRKSEKARLRKGVIVLVGTPGRLLDHLKSTESFSLQQLRWVVLDEADRLLDLGFEQTVLEILSIIRGERLPGLREKIEKDPEPETLQQKWKNQTTTLGKQCRDTSKIQHIMASATLTRAVRQLAVPVMGDTGLVVVDAEKEKIDIITSASDIFSLGKDTGRLDGRLGGEVSNHRDEDDGEDEEATHNYGGLEKGEAMEAPQQLAQYYMTVHCKWRLAALVSFLRAHNKEKVLVFFATCDSVDFHALLLANTTWPIALDNVDGHPTTTAGDGGSNGGKMFSNSLEPLPSSFTGILGDECRLYRLHGSVPQKVRQVVYKEFCAATTGVMLCTDVAARGLDLPRVDWILQYDPPCETTDYVHRVGRTARRGLHGSALLFLMPSESLYLPLLNSHSLNPLPLTLQSLFMETAKLIPGVKKFTNVDEMTAVTLQRRFETTILNNRPLLDAARQAFRSFVRAYATHSSDTKGIFRVQTLHLGHVAKSFGLRESPKAIRNHEDIIGKIFNGEYSVSLLEDQQQQSMKAKGGSKSSSMNIQKQRGGFGAINEFRKKNKDITETGSDYHQPTSNTNSSSNSTSTSNSSSNNSHGNSNSEKRRPYTTTTTTSSSSSSSLSSKSNAVSTSVSPRNDFIVPPSSSSSSSVNSNIYNNDNNSNNINNMKKSKLMSTSSTYDISRATTTTTTPTKLSPVNSILAKRKQIELPVKTATITSRTLAPESDNKRPKYSQKLRKVGKLVTASGNFRKSDGGYFKKSLRKQSNSEFIA